VLPVIKVVNRFLPENLRLLLLPYYRRFFPRMSHIIFMPDLRCNYACPYCLVNRFTPAEFKKASRPYREWVRVFERFPPSAVTITGGEPLLYPDLAPLIRSFPRRHLVSSLVSNLGLDLNTLFSLKKRDFRIMASFHPAMTTREAFLEKLLALRRHGYRNVTVNFVAHPAALREIPTLKKYFEAKSGFYFRVDTYKDPAYAYSAAELSLVREYKRTGIIAADRTEGYDFNDGTVKRCKAGSRYIVIIPNGNVYTCMEGYYYAECPPYKDKHSGRDVFYAGNVFEGTFAFAKEDKICRSPCAELCDIEMAGVRR